MLPGITGIIASLVNFDIEYFNVAWNAGTAFAFPSGTAVGDFACLIDHTYSSGMGTFSKVVPTGFTECAYDLSNDGDGTKVVVSYGTIASLTPPNGMTTPNATPQFASKGAIIIRPTRPITTITPTWDIDVAGYANPTSSSTGFSADVEDIVVAIGYTGSNLAGATTHTDSPVFQIPELNNGFSAGIRCALGISIYKGNSVGHSVDIGDLNDSNVTAAGHFILRG